MTPTPDPLRDDEKLLVLAAWFDMWDATAYENRQRILDDPRNPGKNDVQRDLRRIAAALAQSAPPLDVERLAEAMRRYLPDGTRNWIRPDPRDAPAIAREYDRLIGAVMTLDPDPLTPPEPIESDPEPARRPGLSVGCARAAIMAALAVFWTGVILLAIALAAPREAPVPSGAGRAQLLPEAGLASLGAPHVPSGSQSAGVRRQSADDWYLVLRGYPSGAPFPEGSRTCDNGRAGTSSSTDNLSHDARPASPTAGVTVSGGLVHALSHDSGVILASGEPRRGLPRMARLDVPQGLRQGLVSGPPVANASLSLDLAPWANPGGALRLPRLRQSGLHRPSALVPGNGSRQHAGHDRQGSPGSLRSDPGPTSGVCEVDGDAGSRYTGSGDLGCQSSGTGAPVQRGTPDGDEGCQPSGVDARGLGSQSLLPAVPHRASDSATASPAALAPMPAPTRSGTWAYALPSHGAGYLAIPEGRGIRVTICGPLGCLSRVSTDAGPALYLQRAGRIGDLSSVDFVTICGPTSRGLCRGGSYTIQAPIKLPETDQ